jgi:hypothetical protein
LENVLKLFLFFSECCFSPEKANHSIKKKNYEKIAQEGFMRAPLTTKLRFVFGIVNETKPGGGTPPPPY